MSPHAKRSVLLALALALATSALADDGEHFEHLFKTRVSVDASGQVTDIEHLEEAPAALRAMVANVARDIPFEPATRDGIPVPSRTPLQLRVAFAPVGEDYRAKVVSIDGGAPVSVGMTPPRFPLSMIRSNRRMVATVVVRPRPDGTSDPEANTVEQIRVYQGDEPKGKLSTRHQRELRNALLQAAREWTYVLEEVDGRAITTEIRVPVTLCSAKRGGRKDTREICGKWRESVMQDYGRPEPVDDGIRLAQPRLQARSAPAA